VLLLEQYCLHSRNIKGLQDLPLKKESRYSVVPMPQTGSSGGFGPRLMTAEPLVRLQSRSHAFKISARSGKISLSIGEDMKRCVWRGAGCGSFSFLEFIFTPQHKAKHSWELYGAHIWIEI